MKILLGKNERELLKRIFKETIYYSDMSKEENITLSHLVQMGLIKWYPYPDEYYMTTTLGNQYFKGINHG